MSVHKTFTIIQKYIQTQGVRWFSSVYIFPIRTLKQIESIPVSKGNRPQRGFARTRRILTTKLNWNVTTEWYQDNTVGQYHTDEGHISQNPKRTSSITKLGFIYEIMLSSLISTAIGRLGCQHLPPKKGVGLGVGQS